MNTGSLSLKNTSSVDNINILLMILSFLLAIEMPFTLFLLAYAVLGPLHYLTEIFWLEKHQYYLEKRKGYIWLLVLSCLVAFLVIIRGMHIPHLLGFLQTFNPNLVSALMFAAITVAIIFTVLNRTLYRLIAFGSSLVLILLLWSQPAWLLLFGVFLSSVIHVCLFTGVFILSGALKNRGLSSWISFILYILLVCLFFVIPVKSGQYSTSSYEYNVIIKSGFAHLNASIAKCFGFGQKGQYDILSVWGLRIQSFLAFIYTYHYLNWFSKVDIIKWNKVSASVKMVTTVTWLLAIALYWYNYRTGLVALFLLSTLHVLLEFPLNIRTFVFIARALYKKPGS
jgi:hypothetical protein